jgi:1-acyl-sn-glycerol-3-phosphate acyltransferase
MMPFARSALFALVFYTGTVLAVLGATPLVLFARQRIPGYAVGWARFHRWCARVLLGIESRVEGAIPTGTVLVAAKHQSMYETLELIVILERPIVVLKRELADIPLWGRLAQGYGAIPVERTGSASALRAMLASARAAMAQRRAILIFPEGTRVSPGEQPPLRSGFTGLYRALGLPVVAIAIDSGRLCPRGRFIKHPGIITFRFAEPAPPGLPRKVIEARVHAAINALDAH